jgi:hypothetical protein
MNSQRKKASGFGEIVLDEIWLQDCRPFDLLKGLKGMEFTVFGKVWSFLILNVSAVIMICVRNCRISLTVIVSFPLFLLFGDRRVHYDLVCVPHPACTAIATSKASMATTAGE